MPKDIPNQIISGNVMSERDCFLHLIEHIGQARASANGLAQLRKDVRWLAICGIFDEMKQKVEILMVKPNGIIVPPRMRRN